MQSNKCLIQNLNNYQINKLLNFKFIILSEKLFFNTKNKKSLNITFKKSDIKCAFKSSLFAFKYPCFLIYNFEYNYFLDCFNTSKSTNFLVKIFNKIIYKTLFLNNFFFNPSYKSFKFTVLTSCTVYNLIISISLFLRIK
jgi:hypothetical protein